MRYTTRLSYAVILTLFTMGSPRAATDITTLTNDLNNLILQGEQLVITTSATTLPSFTKDASLASLDTSVNDYRANAQAVYDSLNSPWIIRTPIIKVRFVKQSRLNPTSKAWTLDNRRIAQSG